MGRGKARQCSSLFDWIPFCGEMVNVKWIVLFNWSKGKSTLMSDMTSTVSEVADYEFTTLSCVPGVYMHNGAKIQLLDLPGIIEGASGGRGRGRQVISTAKGCDIVLMVLDATKDDTQKEKLENELEAVGIRLNKNKPRITVTRKKIGGIAVNSAVPQEHLNNEAICAILKEYKIHNANVFIGEDCTLDDLVDTIQGNAVYVKCIYAYNKIDMLSLAEIEEFARKPHSVVISSSMKWNIDQLRELIWQYLGLVRIYTKKKGDFPDLSDPVILTRQRGDTNIEMAVRSIHAELFKEFKTALVWGSSVRHQPQQVSLAHVVEDEDVVQIIKKFG